MKSARYKNIKGMQPLEKYNKKPPLAVKEGRHNDVMSKDEINICLNCKKKKCTPEHCRILNKAKERNSNDCN